MTEAMNKFMTRPVDDASIQRWTTATGMTLLIRPITGDDEARMRQFHRSLSEMSVYRRYFRVLPLEQRIEHGRLDRACHPDAREEDVRVAARCDGDGQIVGVARLSHLPDDNGDAGDTDDVGGLSGPARPGELAVIVADAYQGLGIGTRLVRTLIDLARAQGMTSIRADILASNVPMQRLCTHLGMRLRPSPTGDIIAELDLTTCRVDPRESVERREWRVERSAGEGHLANETAAALHADISLRSPRSLLSTDPPLPPQTRVRLRLVAFARSMRSGRRGGGWGTRAEGEWR
jgi:acetyltransferase